VLGYKRQELVYEQDLREPVYRKESSRSSSRSSVDESPRLSHDEASELSDEWPSSSVEERLSPLSPNSPVREQQPAKRPSVHAVPTDSVLYRREPLPEELVYDPEPLARERGVDPGQVAKEGGDDPELKENISENAQEQPGPRVEKEADEERIPTRRRSPAYDPMNAHRKPGTGFYLIFGANNTHWMYPTQNHTHYSMRDVFACKDSKDWTPAMIGSAVASVVLLTGGGFLTMVGGLRAAADAAHLGMTVGGVVGLALGIVFFCYCCVKSFSLKD
jgi:hypothetical protein